MCSLHLEEIYPNQHDHLDQTITGHTWDPKKTIVHQTSQQIDIVWDPKQTIFSQISQQIHVTPNLNLSCKRSSTDHRSHISAGFN